MKRIFGILLAVTIWLRSAIENRFLIEPWADWLCMSLTILLGIVMAYALWQEHDESRKRERKQMRTSQQIADEENRRAYLRETMAA